MTTKHLTGLYSAGYALSAGYSTLIVDKTAQVQGSGVSAATIASITNYGSIQATGTGTGLYLAAGGSLANGAAGVTGALISGAIGVYVGAGVATVTNYGTIQGTSGVGVGFKSSGDRLIAEKGSTFLGAVHGGGGTLELASANGVITGLGASGTVSGGQSLTFSGFGSYVLDAGGAWTLAGSEALSAGQTITNQGALVVAGTLTNIGTILSVGGGYGLTIAAHGTVTNGGTAATSALIQGYFDGLYGQSGGGQTINNFGTIRGQHLDGVQLRPGGKVNNGSATSTTALITGAYDGVYAAFFVATVTNFGAIYGAGSEGVLLGLGGSVANGSSSAATGLITGYFNGVYTSGALGTVVNFGSIQGLHLAGVALAAGGTVVNGGLAVSGASITGYVDGVYATAAAATVSNFGTILGTHQAGAAIQNGTVINGASGATAALISGYVGVYAIAAGAVTVTNFGTIRGTTGASVRFGSSADRLIAQAGSTFLGWVQGGGGTLELASGSGSISGLGVAGAVSGAEAIAFTGFGAYIIDAGGSWTMTGANSLAANQTLISQGSLVLAGALTNAGTVSAGPGLTLSAGGLLTNGGVGATAAMITGTTGVYAGAAGAATVTNFGTIQATGSTSVQFKSAADRLIVEAGSTFVGAVLGGGGTLELAGGSGTISGLGGRATLSGSEAMTFSGFGSYVVDTGGSWIFAGADTLATNQTLTNQGSLSVTGTLTNTGAIQSGAGLALSAGGSLINGGALSGAIGVYAGAAGSSTVTNFGTIQGTSGTSIRFNAASDRLIVEVGGAFIGAVYGGGGSLELAAGQGTISGLGSSFRNFGTYQIDAGGTWSFLGVNNLASGASLTVGGALTNGGTIVSSGPEGIILSAGSSLVNGGGSSPGALISGAVGVYAGVAGSVTVTNFGSIQGTSGVAIQFSSQADCLVAEAGSTCIGVVHGGGGTLELAGGAGTISGLGVGGAVSGAEAMSFSGFGSYQIDAGSSWTLTGVNTLSANQTIANLGAISGALVLGSATDRLILGAGATLAGSIQGGGGVLELAAGTGTLTGLGTSLIGFGAYLVDTGGLWTLTGSTTLASGSNLVVGGALSNLGAITSSSGVGVVLNAGGSLVNGSNTSTVTLISGLTGVYAGAGLGGVLTNFGTIQGTGGTAVQFKSASDRLIAEAGSSMLGLAQGGGGILELANGVGTISGLGGNGTVSGTDTMSFSGFGSYQIDAGSSWTLAGADTLSANQTLIAFGTLNGNLGFGANSARLVVEAGASLAGTVSGGAGTLELASGTGSITGIGAVGVISGAAAMTFSGFGSYLVDAASSWTMTGADTIAAGKTLTVAGSLANSGALVSSAADGVVLSTGGAVVNGSSGARAAMISGIVGVYGAGTLTNFGTIQGTSGTSVRFNSASARLIAQSGSTFVGAVQGGGGNLELANGTGAIASLGFKGTVTGGDAFTFSGFGSYTLDAGGSWTLNGVNGLATNQSLTNLGALTIAGTLTNSGAIGAGAGLSLGLGGHMTNALSTAIIFGAVGVYGGVLGKATVTNFGVIQGTSGVAVAFKAATDRLISQSGSSILGVVQGGGGTLELGAATGTIVGLGNLGGVTGGESLTFSGFGAYVFDAGGLWTLNGSSAVYAGHSLTNLGVINLAGPLTVAGSLVVAGNITGSGTVSLAGSAVESVTAMSVQSVALSEAAGTTLTIGKGAVLSLTASGSTLAGVTTGKGTLNFGGGAQLVASGATMTVSTWTLTGGATSINETLTFKGAFSESATATLSVAAGKKLNLSGSTLFSGVLNGSGVVVVTKATFNGLIIGGTTSMQVSGTSSQTGTVTIGDSVSNGGSIFVVTGSTYSIKGAFGIAGGTPTGNGLIVGGTLTRSGAAGLSVIAPAVYDAGLILATAGTLDFRGNLTGTGSLSIGSSATLQLDAKVSNTLSLSFAGPAATLALSSPAGFGATISGFAISDTIDLLAQAATGASISASDQLVIVNGATTVATLQLTGVFSGATFTIGSDGRGGTNITLFAGAGVAGSAVIPGMSTPPTQTSAQAFASAMAHLGAGGEAAVTHTPPRDPWSPSLLSPIA